MDLVKKSGDKINLHKLSKALGCEIVETSALKGYGSMEAADKAISLAGEKNGAVPQHKFSEQMERALTSLSEIGKAYAEHQNLRWLAIKLFERDEKVHGAAIPSGKDTEKIEAIIHPLKIHWTTIVKALLQTSVIYISQI